MVRLASASVDLRQSFAVFVRGSLRTRQAAVGSLWNHIALTWGLGELRQYRYRDGGSVDWRNLPACQTDFVSSFLRGGNAVGCWSLEIAPPESEAGTHVQLADLQPVRGVERASHVRVVFAPDVQAAEMAGLCEWTINHLPLWWGVAGYTFHHVAGRLDTAYLRIAALARRYWATQILDFTTLQWDAIHGMPGINWLTMVGREFASEQGVAIDGIPESLPDGVHCRLGVHGIALAAGARPIKGDINLAEDLSAYVHVARALEPLIVRVPSPLPGPFANIEMLRAWINRFAEPEAWLAS